MNNKKLIISTALITLLIIEGVFLTVKISSYLLLKKDCQRNNSKPDGYSFSIYIKSETSQSDIDKFINEAKKIAHVKNIQSETKDYALQEFIKNHQNDPEIINSLDKLGSNPFLSAITINSDISNLDDFLRFEQGVLDKAGNSGLAIQTRSDGNLIFFQKELAKMKKASLIRDLPSYIFSGEGNHFFEKKYSVICNPNFPRK
jgi:hypothetical protein